jgi:hypothetical protein
MEGKIMIKNLIIVALLYVVVEYNGAEIADFLENHEVLDKFEKIVYNILRGAKNV